MKNEGMFSRILVPTDFSAGSQRAWAMAQQLAATPYPPTERVFDLRVR